MDGVQEELGSPTIDFVKVKSEIMELINNRSPVTILFFTGSRRTARSVDHFIYSSIETKYEIIRYNQEVLHFKTKENVFDYIISYYPSSLAGAIRGINADYVYIETETSSGVPVVYDNSFILLVLGPILASGKPVQFFRGNMQ